MSRYAEQAWTIIEAFSLNGDIIVLGDPVKRFVMLDKKGSIVDLAKEAVCLYDRKTGNAFLPQNEPNWTLSLIDAYKIKLDWIEAENAWEAVARHHEMSAKAQGATVEIAVFAAMEALAQEVAASSLARDLRVKNLT